MLAADHFPGVQILATGCVYPWRIVTVRAPLAGRKGGGLAHPDGSC